MTLGEAFPLLKALGLFRGRCLPNYSKAESFEKNVSLSMLLYIDPSGQWWDDSCTCYWLGIERSLAFDQIGLGILLLLLLL